MSAPSPRDRIRASFPEPETTLQSTLSIPEQRLAWERQAAQPVPPGVRVEEVTWGVAGRLVTPPGAADGPLVIHAHGGGFVTGSSKTHLALGIRIAQAAKARLLLVDYRRAPEHQYPAARDDFLAAYEAVLERGIPARSIVISGDSAGAHVALSALLAADLRTLPPLLVQAGSDEILLSDATRIGERIRAADGRVQVDVWPGLWHVFHQSAPELPEAVQAIEQLGVFVAAQAVDGSR